MTLNLNLTPKQEEILLAEAQAKGIAPEELLRSLIDELSPEAKVLRRLKRLQKKAGEKLTHLSIEEYNAFCNDSWEKMSPEEQARELQIAEEIGQSIINRENRFNIPSE